MSELRLILLVAGLALLIGIYLWGLRQRAASRRDRSLDATVETSTVAPGETAPIRRSEPQFAPHETTERGFTRPPVEEDDIETPAIERLGSGRREPTFGVRVEPDVQPVLDIHADARRDAVENTEPVIANADDFRPAKAGAAETQVQPRAEPRAEPRAAPSADPSAGSKPPQKIVALRVVAPAETKFSGVAIRQAFDAEYLQFGRYNIFHRLHTDGRPVFSVASQKEPGTFDPATIDATNLSGIALFTVLPGPLPPLDAFDQLVYAARSLAARLGGAIADERGAPINLQRISRMREDVLAFEGQFSGEAG